MSTVLIGLRLFKQLEVRGDSVTALTMLMCMKHEVNVNLVARELALDLADGCFRPDVARHIAGVSNKCADILSRRFQPGKEFELPFILSKVEEFIPPTRDGSSHLPSPL